MWVTNLATMTWSSGTLNIVVLMFLPYLVREQEQEQEKEQEGYFFFQQEVEAFSFPNDWYKIRQMMEERRNKEVCTSKQFS